MPNDDLEIGLFFFKCGQVSVGSLTVSPMGLGTWAWGNKFLWGYDETMDQELQEAFNLAINSGVNLFDTADSYGTGRLNGRSELLLGRFIQNFPGFFDPCIILSLIKCSNEVFILQLQ